MQCCHLVNIHKVVIRWSLTRHRCATLLTAVSVLSFQMLIVVFLYRLRRCSRHCCACMHDEPVWSRNCWRSLMQFAWSSCLRTVTLYALKWVSTAAEFCACVNYRWALFEFCTVCACRLAFGVCHTGTLTLCLHTASCLLSQRCSMKFL